MMVSSWRRSRLAACAAALLLGAAPAPLSAQLPVVDPANLAQNILQAAHALEQIHNQLAQIDQQARMLAHSPLQLSTELSASIAQARTLFHEARGIAFEVGRLNEEIRALYPETWETFDLGEIGARSRRWIEEDRASLERALRAQAQAAASIEAARGRLDRALRASADAQGQTSAVQAGNQLLGVSAEQLAGIHALLVAQGRALATERLERVAREERALDIQRRAFPGDRPAPTTPARNAFGS